MSSRARRRRRREEEQSEIIFAADGVTLEAGSDDGSSSPSADVLAYTGGKLALANFPHPAVINLDGSVRAMDPQQLPFLRDHDQTKAVGHGQPNIEASQLRQSGKLSIAGEERDKITAASKDGFRWQASIGGRIPNRRKDVQTIAAGDRVKVNGQVFDGPIHVINAFLWKETSFVALGADEGRASAKVAAAQTSGVTPMTDFDKWLEASGVNSEELTDSQLGNLKAAYEATLTPPKKQEDDELDMSKVVTAATTAAVEAAQKQSQRDRRIDQLFASYGDTTLSKEKVDELRANVEAGKVSEDRAHLELLQASRAVGSTNTTHTGGGEMSDLRALEIEAGLGRTAGLTEEQIHENLVEAGASKDQAEAAVGRSAKKPKGLKSLIMAVCREAGHHCDEVDDDAIRAAMRHSERNHGRNVQAASGGFSTIEDLSGILSRMANKAMLAAYAEADNGGVATQICSTTSTRDFKQFDRYRMTEAGVMELVPATGEIPHGTLTQEAYANQVKTYGKIIALSRQMIRNDDLDAFLQIPRMIGRMGRHSLEQITITTLVDAPTNAGAGTTEFFHGAARGNQEPNYLEGAATALGFDALEPAYELFLNQVDNDGKPIMIDPSILLCTNADIVAARKLYTDTQYRFTGSDRTETINNQWEGMFEPIKSSYLHRLGATPSSTQWYLLSRPSIDVSGIQIAFLDGQQTPVIQQSETSFNTLGMQMRGYFDFGVALQDPRAIVKVKGAA